ncbi:MAG: sulfite exporter TauE/SafE family protein, partial [Thermodesulfobacteriota bacterium]
MSDLSQFEELIRNWSFLSIPLAVFVASILGSTHCVTMCGPIAITVNNSSGYMSLYHVGRLISYLILGALAGLLGEAFLSNNTSLISTISITLISIFFIYTGYRLVRG